MYEYVWVLRGEANSNTRGHDGHRWFGIETKLLTGVFFSRHTPGLLNIYKVSPEPSEMLPAPRPLCLSSKSQPIFVPSSPQHASSPPASPFTPLFDSRISKPWPEPLSHPGPPQKSLRSPMAWWPISCRGVERRLDSERSPMVRIPTINVTFYQHCIRILFTFYPSRVYGIAFVRAYLLGVRVVG